MRLLEVVFLEHEDEVLFEALRRHAVKSIEKLFTPAQICLIAVKVRAVGLGLQSIAEAQNLPLILGNKLFAIPRPAKLFNERLGLILGHGKESLAKVGQMVHTSGGARSLQPLFF